MTNGSEGQLEIGKLCKEICLFGVAWQGYLECILLRRCFFTILLLVCCQLCVGAIALQQAVGISLQAMAGLHLKCDKVGIMRLGDRGSVDNSSVTKAQNQGWTSLKSCCSQKLYWNTGG
jgi:hypothetical protein